MKNDKESIGAVLGRIPSGCHILTVQHGGRSTGMLASWVQQAAFDPPTVTVCLKRGRAAAPMVDAAGRFVLNSIGEPPTKLFKHFGKGFAPEEDAFVGLTIQRSEFGPVLADGIAAMGCEIRQKIAVGDHDLYVAEVKCGSGGAPANPHVHIRTTGLSY